MDGNSATGFPCRNRTTRPRIDKPLCAEFADRRARLALVAVAHGYAIGIFGGGITLGMKVILRIEPATG